MEFIIKGRSLSTSDMRQLVNKLRNELKDRSIPILCECYDGQWYRLCTFDEIGFPLTHLQLQHLSWCDVMNWSKDKCLEFLLDSNKVNQNDKESLCAQYFKTGTHQDENIEVTRMPLFHELHLCSSDGKIFGEVVAGTFHLSSREELWK